MGIFHHRQAEISRWIHRAQQGLATSQRHHRAAALRRLGQRRPTARGSGRGVSAVAPWAKIWGLEDGDFHRKMMGK